MIYFVDEQFIKVNTQLSKNIDWSDIAPNIRVAAITYPRNQLGKVFFDDLLSKFNAGTLSSIEDELVELVKYITAFRAADLTVPFLSFSIKNKGIQSQSGNFSASEGLEVLNYMRNEIKKFAHIKEKELKEFLKENEKDFPLYTSEDNKKIVKPEAPESGTGFDII